MIAAAVVIFGALAVGLIANRMLQPRITAYNKDHGIGAVSGQISIGSIFAPVATLTVFFLGFALLTGAQSYSQAKIAVGSEAAVVDNIFETAAYLQEPYKRRLQRAAVCYARAVAGPEWQSMGKGSIERSPVPSNWTGSGHNGIRKAFHDMGPGAPLFTNLLAADQKRGDARRDRLAQASPKIPGIVVAFLLIGIALGIGFLAMASPRTSPLHIAAVTLAAVVLFAAVFLIHSLDRPYSGPLALNPVAMQDSADDDAEDFIDEYGKSRVRCDQDGNPTGSRQ